MNKIKWAFFGYLLACGLILVGMGVSFAITRTRDANTLYGSYHGNLKTLDPAEVGDAGAADLDGYVYECLYNYAYGEDQYRLIPELAAGDPVVTDGGLNHQLAATGNFGTVVRRNYPVALARAVGGDASETVSIVGPLCTPLDRLADRIAFPQAQVGDVVAVFLAGAYGPSASPAGFLGHPPAMEILA